MALLFTPLIAASLLVACPARRADPGFVLISNDQMEHELAWAKTGSVSPEGLHGIRSTDQRGKNLPTLAREERLGSLAATAAVVLPVWAKGLLACLFGSTLTALGLVLQKHAHVMLAGAGETTPPSPYFCHRWWLLGFLCYISAQVINMMAMAMTPQCVLSCLGSWTLVCNTAFARVILGEVVTPPQQVAVAGLVVATALVVCSAPRPPPDGESARVSAVELPQRLGSPEFEVTTILLLSIVLLLRVVAEGAARSFPKRAPRLFAAAWAVAAAVATGYTALFFKCIAEILATSAMGLHTAEHAARMWQTWGLVGLAFSCAPLELHCLNSALRFGEASLVVPMYLALGMLSQLCMGAAFFGELGWFNSRSDVATFAASVTVLLTCVVTVAVLQVDDRDEGDVQAEEPASNRRLLERLHLVCRQKKFWHREGLRGEEDATRAIRAMGGRWTTPSAPRRPTVQSAPSVQHFKEGGRVSVAGFGAATELLCCTDRRHTVSAVFLGSGPHRDGAAPLKSPSEGKAPDKAFARSMSPDLASSPTSGLTLPHKAAST